MNVSIVILDFEKSTHVVENVRSLVRQKTDFDFEIIVAVNSATEVKRAKFAALENEPNVKFIFNSENLGYPRGINEAVKKSNGEILTIINPDIICRDEATLAKLVKKIESDLKIGVLAPRQIRSTDGQTEMTIRAFPKLSNQIARRTWLRKLPKIRDRVAHDEMQHLDYTKTQEVDWLQSSFWVVRRSLWEELGGLDERFFLFMSDPDFCRRVWDAGKSVVYFPEVTVNADGERCSAGGFLTFFKKWTLRQHLRDAWKYYQKWSGKENHQKN